MAYSNFLARGRVDNINLILLMNGLDHLLEDHTLLGFHLAFVSFHMCLERLLLFFAAGSTPGETLRLYHHAFISAGQFKRVVLDVLAGPSKYRVKKLLLRRQFGLALRHHLAYQNIARAHPRPFPDYPMLTKVSKRLLADIRNIAGKLFSAKTGLTNFRGKLINVNARETVVFDQLFADNNCILKVKTIVRDKSDKHVLAQRQDAVAGTATIRYHLIFAHLISRLDYSFLIKTGPFIQTDKL